MGGTARDSPNRSSASTRRCRISQDCAFTTPEADLDWSSVVHMGGRARALDRRMPAFGEALSGLEIDSVIHHLRSFCAEPSWPRGELNFPRRSSREGVS
jgi:hypothetical protein